MAMGLSNRLIHAQLGVQPDDFVLMNTVALYVNYRTYVYWLLETGRLKRAVWFIHEDNPKLQFNNKREIARIKALVAKNLIQIYVPSIQTADDYNRFFETSTIKPVLLKVDVPKALTKQRTAKDFKTISFVTSGSPWDGRKGQFLLVNGLLYFEKYLRSTKATYRPYDLHLLALGDDYISKQLITIGKAFWGDKCKTYEKIPREAALAITHACNLTVCTSLNETFALFVAEGMAMGHPIIRNKTSGWQEQIQDSKNGFIFDDLNLRELAEKIEAVLNTNTLSNEQLAKMGQVSQNIIAKHAHASYYKQLYVD